MSTRHFFGFLCAGLLLLCTAAPAGAQALRPDHTVFIKPRAGISNYLGDNEKSPANFNFDLFKIDGKLPFNVAVELGYQFSVPFSLSAAYQLGDYPVITQFGDETGSERGIDQDPTIRHTAAVIGRYAFANARSRVAPYLNFGFGASFGNVRQRDGTETFGRAFGPLLGLGLDVALNDRTSFFVETTSTVNFSDTELDANDRNQFGSTDVLSGFGLGLKINFKRAFTPVEVFAADCPDQLTIGQSGSFSATTNDDRASQPIEYRWDYGDGGTGTGMSATHSFAQAGTYTVTFTATNSGSTDSATCTVRVIAPAEVVTITADRTTVDTCEPTPITFSANVRGDAPLAYRWDFGDGGTSTQANPSHTYSQPGTYTVTLTLTNEAATDTRTTTISVEACAIDVCADVTELNTVFFDRNASVLTPQAREQLMENVQVLKDCPNVCVRLEGYASQDERSARRLSEDRARAVEQFYTTNGLTPGRLTTLGLGAQGQTTKKGGADQFRRVDSIPTPCEEGGESSTDDASENEPIGARS